MIWSKLLLEDFSDINDANWCGVLWFSDTVIARAGNDIPRVAIHRGDHPKLCRDRAPHVHKSKISGAPEAWRRRRIIIIIIIIIIIGELEDRMAVKHISSLGGQEPIWHSHWGRGTRNPHHSLRNGLLLRPNDRSLLPSHSEIEPNTIRQVHIWSYTAYTYTTYVHIHIQHICALLNNQHCQNLIHQNDIHQYTCYQEDQGQGTTWCWYINVHGSNTIWTISQFVRVFLLMDHALNKIHLDVKTYPQHEGEKIILVVYVYACKLWDDHILSRKCFTP